jgi:hypothetical protein
MTARPADLDLAFSSGAIAALRKRAAAIRKRAVAGVTVVDGRGSPVVIKSSEAAHLLDIARDLDAIADDLEGAP